MIISSAFNLRLDMSFNFKETLQIVDKTKYEYCTYFKFNCVPFFQLQRDYFLKNI